MEEPTHLGFVLGKVHRAARRRWEAALVELGLTAPQAALLRMIASHPGLGVRELARSLGTDPMNVSRLSETLAGRGLVVTSTAPSDRRRHCLVVTEEGIALAREVACRADAEERALEGDLGQPTYDNLMQSLLLALNRLDPSPAGRPTAEVNDHAPR